MSPGPEMSPQCGKSPLFDTFLESEMNFVKFEMNRGFAVYNLSVSFQMPSEMSEFLAESERSERFHLFAPGTTPWHLQAIYIVKEQ